MSTFPVSKLVTSLFSSATVMVPSIITMKLVLSAQPDIQPPIMDVTMSRISAQEPETINPQKLERLPSGGGRGPGGGGGGGSPGDDGSPQAPANPKPEEKPPKDEKPKEKPEEKKEEKEKKPPRKPFESDREIIFRNLIRSLNSNLRKMFRNGKDVFTVWYKLVQKQYSQKAN